MLESMRGTLLLTLFCTAGFAQTALTVVSSATYEAGGAVAPGMIATGFSAAITPGTGYSVTVGTQAATVLAAAQGQISFVLPANLATGNMTVTVTRAGANVAAGQVRAAPVAPGIYTANADGRGAPAGLLLHVALNGTRNHANLFTEDSKGRFLPSAFDPAGPGEYFLQLFGTGFRAHTGPITASIGSTPVPVLGAAAQAEFAGLDQINLGPVPASVSGKLGETELRIRFGDQAANPVVLAPAMPATGEWGRRAALPLANSEMSVAGLDGKIYVLGGYPASRVTSAAVQMYDSATDTWTMAAPLPAPVNHSMPAVTGGKLYIIGGQSDSGNASFVNTTYEYDPAANSWRTRATMPAARGGGAADSIDGKIYVAGSRPPRGADFAVFDPAANTWTALPDMPTQRNHLAAVAFEGKLYVIGGRFEAGFTSPVTDAVEIYDPRTNTWTRGANMPRPRGGLNAVAARGCIHVFGGEGNRGGPNGLFPDHDVYDPVADTWTNLDPIPVPIHGVTGLVFLNGLIYLPGGGTAEGGSSGGTQHQVYRPRQTCR